MLFAYTYGTSVSARTQFLTKTSVAISVLIILTQCYKFRFSTQKSTEYYGLLPFSHHRKIYEDDRCIIFLHSHYLEYELPNANK